MTLPARGRLIAVDVGHVRVGLAACDEDRILTSPLETYARQNAEKDAAHFIRLAKAESCVGWVVGLPIMLSGEEGSQSKTCRDYGAWLGSITGLPVAFHDERFTSSLAEDALLAAGLTSKRRKARVDRVAAQLILMGYMEANPSSSSR